MADSTPPPEPSAWVPPKLYAHIDELTGETTLVDANGTPIPSPPGFHRIVNGGVQVKDPWGNNIPIYEPPTAGIFVHVAADGTPQVVDANGQLIPSPPTVWRDGADPTWRVMGQQIDIPTYQPRTESVFVHVAADGTPQVVDANGQPVQSPPTVWRDGADPTWRVMGQQIEIPIYEPPTAGIFVHVGADGTPQVVDANGQLVQSPPAVWRDGADPTWRVMGKEIELPIYEPPTTGIYVHQSPDGDYQVVDANGNLVTSPPYVYRDGQTGEFSLAGPSGPQIAIYQPPTSGIYVHVDASGDYQVVDASGNLVTSPPHVIRDPESGTYVVVGSDGPGPQIPTYWPPTGEPPQDWPPPVEDDVQDDQPSGSEPSSEPDDVVAEATGSGEDGRRSAPIDDVETVANKEAEAVAETPVMGVESTGLEPEETDEVSATPIPLPDPPTPADDQISATPIPLPDPPTPPDDQISATPIPLPDPPTPPDDQISATPIPLPDPPPSPPGDEISATPIPLPDPPPSPPGDEISATPIPLPDPPPSPPGDQVSATPITLPSPPSPPDGEISATPITLPDPPTPPDDEIAATPITLPSPPSPPGDQVSATPITLPSPPSPPDDQISATPITLPSPPTPPDDIVSATPITLPSPPTPPDDIVSATPITLPSPPSPPDDIVSATPITLPSPPSPPDDQISATPITLPSPPTPIGTEGPEELTETYTDSLAEGIEVRPVTGLEEPPWARIESASPFELDTDTESFVSSDLEDDTDPGSGYEEAGEDEVDL